MNWFSPSPERDHLLDLSSWALFIICLLAILTACSQYTGPLRERAVVWVMSDQPCETVNRVATQTGSNLLPCNPLVYAEAAALWFPDNDLCLVVTPRPTGPQDLTAWALVWHELGHCSDMHWH